MGTVVHVPQTRDMIGEELSGDEALTALRHYGGRRLLLDAFARFRYADGFRSCGPPHGTRRGTRTAWSPRW